MPEVKNKKLILVDYIVSIVIVIAIITYFIVLFISLNNWKNSYHELELSYSEELLEAEIYVEAIEEFADYEIEIAELQAELKYLKEHFNLIIDKEIAQEEQYRQEQYLETMFKLVSDANKELIKYGLYLDYDGKIYKMEE